MLNKQQEELVVSLLEVELEVSLDQYYNTTNQVDKEGLLESIKLTNETLKKFNYHSSSRLLEESDKLLIG